MKPALLSRYAHPSRRRERGVTMVLVALAMIAIIAMAALSIDVITLYLAREEAQRSADASALAAARVISMSGLTGDPSNTTGSWQLVCGGTASPATQAAVAVATQSAVGGASVPAPSVLYSAGAGAPTADCSTLPAAGPFSVNPMITVHLSRASLPTFFSRIWGNPGNSISATATAEVFNPSASDLTSNGGPLGTVTPVQPRCVKPFIVPNRDPLNPDLTCDQTGGPCNKFVSLTDGSIIKPGTSLNGTNANGVIGGRFWLAPDCIHTGGTCATRANPPVGNYYDPSRRRWLEQPPSLQFLPGTAPTVAPIAVPFGSGPGRYREAVGGCDQTTVYQCGVQSSSSSNPNSVDLLENPGWGSGDTVAGITSLIHEGDATDTQPDGQDTLDTSAYPFKILAGNSNPLVTAASPAITAGTAVTSSTSIVSLPIYDDTAVAINGSGSTNVTIVGFLQVFIKSVDQWGNMEIIVLNVVGCGNGGTVPVSASAVTGSSPLPIRLITSP
jgi:hypothetical protein